MNKNILIDNQMNEVESSGTFTKLNNLLESFYKEDSLMNESQDILINTKSKEQNKMSKLFYSMLNEDTVMEYDDSGKCLITHEPLNSNHIKLNCGHEFNYLPLFKYLVNFKKLFNRDEHKRLNSQQVICPYCRTIQDSLIPYIEIPGVKKIHGVNSIMYSPSMKGRCESLGCSSTTVHIFYPENKSYCYYHCCIEVRKNESKNKKEEKLQNRCTYVYVRGVNAGKQCPTIAKVNCLCSKHSPKKKVIENTIDEIPEADMPYL